MLNANSILAKIEENMQAIKEYGIKNIGLFGSYIKGEQNAASDVDILVDFLENQKTFDNYIDLKFFLEDLLERKVGLVIYETIKPAIKIILLGVSDMPREYKSYLSDIIGAINKVKRYTQTFLRFERLL